MDLNSIEKALRGESVQSAMLAILVLQMSTIRLVADILKELGLMPILLSANIVLREKLRSKSLAKLLTKFFRKILLIFSADSLKLRLSRVTRKSNSRLKALESVVLV
jgi:hypothetical protein